MVAYSILFLLPAHAGRKSHVCMEHHCLLHCQQWRQRIVLVHICTALSVVIVHHIASHTAISRMKDERERERGRERERRYELEDLAREATAVDSNHARALGLPVLLELARENVQERGLSCSRAAHDGDELGTRHEAAGAVDESALLAWCGSSRRRCGGRVRVARHLDAHHVVREC